MIPKQIENLKVLLHAKLTVNRGPEERDVQEALDNTSDIEHGEKSGIINEMKRRLTLFLSFVYLYGRGDLKHKINYYKATTKYCNECSVAPTIK